MHKSPLFLLLAAVVLSFISCSNEELAELTAEEFDRILSASISAENLPVEKLAELDSYESYFLARKAASFGYADEAVLLSHHCWKEQGGFIGEKAAELCVELNIEAGKLSEAEFYASIAAAQYPGNYSFRRAAAEAEYWQHEDEELLESLSDLLENPKSAEDYELLLFRAVAAFRQKLPDWRCYWIDFVKTAPASDYIRRGWDYLGLELEAPADEFPVFARLFEAKYLYSTGKYREASTAFADFIINVQPQELTEAVADDIENSFLRSGEKRKGAELLEAAASTTGLDYCLFAAARLYRRAGLNFEAGRCMDSLLTDKDEDKLTERELWYSFDIKVRSRLSDAMESLDFYIARWTNPDFFADSLDLLCTELARRRQWSSVGELALKLEESGPFDVYDRCRYISERASELGYIGKTGVKRPYSSLYYRILDGDSLPEFGTGSAVSEKNTRPEIINEAEKYIDGLIRYKQDNVLEEIKKYRTLLSEDFLSYCADSAVLSGRMLDSIRIMYQYDGELTATGLQRLYPVIYREQIEKNAGENGIPVQLMLGIVWKESGFENEIVSRSGAVGLSQLMPSTADDVARRNRAVVSDLTNPDENLAIGSWYVNWLTGYVGNMAAAVLSYNGGPGRVKGWLRNFPELPDDLIYEIVPVAETHQYGKRVLTASVLYGLLYYNIEPEETVRIFFS